VGRPRTVSQHESGVSVMTATRLEDVLAGYLVELMDLDQDRGDVLVNIENLENELEGAHLDLALVDDEIAKVKDDIAQLEDRIEQRNQRQS
jgi:peptidoglycan hydrolase CwlO-like protein